MFGAKAQQGDYTCPRFPNKAELRVAPVKPERRIRLNDQAGMSPLAAEVSVLIPIVTCLDYLSLHHESLIFLALANKHVHPVLGRRRHPLRQLASQACASRLLPSDLDPTKSFARYRQLLELFARLVIDCTSNLDQEPHPPKELEATEEKGTHQKRRKCAFVFGKRR